MRLPKKNTTARVVTNALDAVKLLTRFELIDVLKQHTGRNALYVGAIIDRAEGDGLIEQYADKYRPSVVMVNCYRELRRVAKAVEPIGELVPPRTRNGFRTKMPTYTVPRSDCAPLSPRSFHSCDISKETYIRGAA